jgi:hypothetical protein
VVDAVATPHGYHAGLGNDPVRLDRFYAEVPGGGLEHTARLVPSAHPKHTPEDPEYRGCRKSAGIHVENPTCLHFN